MTDNALGQDLTGRLAVVTGGAQDIGRSIVEALAEAGGRLVIADLNPETGERTAAEVGAEFVRIDVTSSTSVSQVVVDLVGAQSSIDSWVNNAGIDRNAAGEEMSDEDWSAVMAVNLDGTFYCCREVGGHMLERGRGFIVNIASMSGGGLQPSATSSGLQRLQDRRHHGDAVCEGEAGRARNQTRISSRSHSSRAPRR
jgi:NAD(P)-dependent dehydrogenase (short-subunit alcohol dehydrogenase family)